MGCGKKYPFWTHDTVASAVLAGAGMASLQNKLDGWASELNLPLVTACVRGWPLVVMFAGLALLLLDSMESKTDETNEEEESRDEGARAVNEAVGDGLGCEEAVLAGPEFFRVFAADVKGQSSESSGRAGGLVPASLVRRPSGTRVAV